MDTAEALTATFILVEINMVRMNSSDASERLDDLIDETAQTHKPIQIEGTHSVGVLLSEEDWRSIQETLHLLSIPGMRESVIEGMQIPIEECEKDLDW